MRVRMSEEGSSFPFDSSSLTHIYLSIRTHIYIQLKFS